MLVREETPQHCLQKQQQQQEQRQQSLQKQDEDADEDEDVDAEEPSPSSCGFLKSARSQSSFKKNLPQGEIEKGSNTDSQSVNTAYNHNTTRKRTSRPEVLLPPQTVSLRFDKSILLRVDPITQSQKQPDYITFQYSIHKPDTHFKRDLALIFRHYEEYCLKENLSGWSSTNSRGDPVTSRQTLDDMIIVPTFQKSIYDLGVISKESNWERDVLLEQVSILFMTDSCH
jgi:hypothetical protein